MHSFRVQTPIWMVQRLALNLVNNILIINVVKREYFPKKHETIKKSESATHWKLHFYPFESMKFSKVIAFMHSFTFAGGSKVCFKFVLINVIEEMPINFTKINQERKCKCSSHLIYAHPCIYKKLHHKSSIGIR